MRKQKVSETNLSHEHGSRRNLHVVAKLEHMLATGYPGIIYPMMYSVMMFKPGVCLIHQPHKLSFLDQKFLTMIYILRKLYEEKYCSSKQLILKIQSAGQGVYLIGCGSDDSNGEGEENCETTSKQHTPPWQLKLINYSHAKMVKAMFAIRMHPNHHSGTCLYLRMSLVWISSLFSWKADLLICHISL
ncbi:LOW QUALITY PROTEIN: hypothetical protein CKAN_01659400 [Cinnamomum micranthum f. kanehirae]|uniref:Uncharacterized protein n=1 Tax=Cinnamomum micranthum f. kanehirae TaxID=337451 RepID=A0A443PA61_9MAGN|nr:LOW QUALITY PROTEIN: hypothetical protein CKAN_01659400 [Cinnamomum micranthum f. kanehirae]